MPVYYKSPHNSQETLAANDKPPDAGLNLWQITYKAQPHSLLVTRVAIAPEAVIQGFALRLSFSMI